MTVVWKSFDGDRQGAAGLGNSPRAATNAGLRLSPEIRNTFAPTTPTLFRPFALTSHSSGTNYCPEA
jgi:hypothetical protein